MCLISVIITNYNYSNFLKECIESCLNQNGGHKYEVLLIDDGSTDDSLDIARLYIDKGLQVIERNNAGIEIASNTVFEMAKGEFVVRVDADDYLHPDYLLNMIPMFDLKFSFIYPDYMIVDQNDNRLGEMKLPNFKLNEVLTRGDFLATGTIYRKDAIKQYGYYNTETKTMPSDLGDSVKLHFWFHVRDQGWGNHTYMYMYLENTTKGITKHLKSGYGRRGKVHSGTINISPYVAAGDKVYIRFRPSRWWSGHRLYFYKFTNMHLDYNTTGNKQGAVGPRGPAGPTGVKGTGLRGPKGDDGKSIKGQIGKKGAQGSQGIAGPSGIKGVRGPRGLTGARDPMEMVFAVKLEKKVLWGRLVKKVKKVRREVPVLV